MARTVTTKHVYILPSFSSRTVSSYVVSCPINSSYFQTCAVILRILGKAWLAFYRYDRSVA